MGLIRIPAFSYSARIALSGFRLRWPTRFEYFCVDLLEKGEPVVLRRAIHPDVSLLTGLNTDVGALYLPCRGENPTINNLGKGSKLKWAANEPII